MIPKAFSVDYYYFRKRFWIFGYTQNDKLPENIKSYSRKPFSTTIKTIMISFYHWNCSSIFQCFEKIAEKFNNSIICHNLNFISFKIGFVEFYFQRRFQFRLKLLLKEGLLRKSNVYKKAKNLTVLDQTLKCNVILTEAQPENKYKFEVQKNFYILNFYKNFWKPKKWNYTIVIPGGGFPEKGEILLIILIIGFNFNI